MIKRSYLIIYLTFIFCLILTTLPLPDWAGPMRPHWVALALIYWCIALPQRIGVFHGFFIGIILDISIGTLFGQHAFTLSIIAFLASNLHARLRIYPIGQQMIVVFILLFIEHLFITLIMGIIDREISGITFWISPLLGVLFWPWVFVILRRIRRQYRVN